MTVSEGQVRLRDLGSTNGTYVNNKRINEILLHEGDRLSIGPLILTFQANGKSTGPQGAEKPGQKNPADTSETISADIEAAIALGPDELEETMADAGARGADGLDSLEAESIAQDIAEQLDGSDTHSG